LYAAIPLLTQSDGGKEANGIANAQTLLRQHYDPRLQGTIQHRWFTKALNVRPEIKWRQLRTEFTPGFEGLFDEGLAGGWFNPRFELDMQVCCYYSYGSTSTYACRIPGFCSDGWRCPGSKLNWTTIE
jgi:hypothetical protein